MTDHHPRERATSPQSALSGFRGPATLADTARPPCAPPERLNRPPRGDGAETPAQRLTARTQRV